MGTPSQPISLTGADCFLRAFHRQTLRVHRSGHLSQLVLRLGPGLDAERLRSVLERAAEANPILRSPIRRSGGIGVPVYRCDLAALVPMPVVALHRSALPRRMQRLTNEAPIPSVFFERLNAPQRIEKGELLRCDVVQYGGGDLGSDFALTWAHMLLDGSGSEEFVRFLDAVASGQKQPGDVPAGDREVACSEAVPEGTFTAVASRARLWQQRIDGFAAHPPRSLAGPAGGEPQALRYAVTTLDEAQTKTVDGRARQMAGILTPMLFYLAATIRAHAAVFEARSAVPASYVVPVPVNLRPKGGEGGLFRTRVSMLWFQALPEHTADLAGLVALLKKQRLELIKSDAISNGIAAMHLVRWTPSRAYVALARRSLKGELASFFFAYTGEFISGLENFMGAPILNGFHTPSVPPSPGSGAIMSIRRGRFNLAHVHQRGVVSDQELDLFRTTLLRDLLGE